MSASATSDWSFSWGRLTAGLFALILVSWIVIIIPVLSAASLDDEATGLMLVVFTPETSDHDNFTRIVNAGGLPVRTTFLENVWVVSGSERGFVGRVKHAGAIGAYRDLPIGIVLAGCSGLIASLSDDS